MRRLSRSCPANVTDGFAEDSFQFFFLNPCLHPDIKFRLSRHVYWIGVCFPSVPGYCWPKLTEFSTVSWVARVLRCLAMKLYNSCNLYLFPAKLFFFLQAEHISNVDTHNQIQPKYTCTGSFTAQLCTPSPNCLNSELHLPHCQENCWKNNSPEQ